MRFFGLRIYDRALWAGPQFEAADFGAYPLALEAIIELPPRAFTARHSPKKRSIGEIERQGDLAPAANCQR